MGTLKQYRFRLPWQNYRAGDVIEPTGVTRDWLLQNGYIEPVPEPAPREPAVAEPTMSSPSAPEPTLPPAATARRRQRASP